MLGSMGAEVARLFVGVDADTSKATSKLDGMGQSAAKTGGVLKGALGTALGFGAATLAMTGLSAAFGSVSDGVFGMNSTLETSTLQFETLMGDADKAQAHVESLFDFAARTPFETGPIIEASRVMQTFGGDALNTKDNLTLFGDAAAATNAPINDIAFWMSRAYAAIQGGQPFGEARMRLMELGVITPQVASELEGLTKSGASSDEVWTSLTGSLDKFGGAMEKQAGTFDGLMATFSDTVGMFLAKAGRPLFEGLKDILGAVNDFAASPAFGAITEALGAGLSQAIGGIVSLFGELATVLGGAAGGGGVGGALELVSRMFDQGLKNVSAFLDGIREPLGNLARSVLPIFQEGLAAVSRVFDNLAPKLEPVAKALGRLAGVVIDGLARGFRILQPLIGPVVDTLGFLAGLFLDALGPGLNLAADALGVFFDAMEPVATFLRDVFLGAINLVLDGIRGLMDLVAQVPGPWQDAARDIRDSIDRIKADQGGMAESVTTAKGEVATATGGMVQSFQEVEAAAREARLEVEKAVGAPLPEAGKPGIDQETAARMPDTVDMVKVVDEFNARVTAAMSAGAIFNAAEEAGASAAKAFLDSMGEGTYDNYANTVGAAVNTALANGGSQEYAAREGNYAGLAFLESLGYVVRDYDLGPDLIYPLQGARTAVAEVGTAAATSLAPVRGLFELWTMGNTVMPRSADLLAQTTAATLAGAAAAREDRMATITATRSRMLYAEQGINATNRLWQGATAATLAGAQAVGQASRRASEHPADAFQEQTPEFRQTLQRFWSHLPGSARNAGAQGARIAASSASDVASAWRESRDSWRSALDLYRDDVKSSMRRAKEVAKLEAILAGKGAGAELAKGLKSKDPVVRAQAQATLDLVRQRLQDLKGIAHTAGYNTGTAYGNGLSGSKQNILADVTGTLKAVGNVIRASSPPRHPLNPLRDIAKWGKWTGEAYAHSLAEGVGLAEGLVPQALDGVTAGLLTSSLGPAGSMTAQDGRVDVRGSMSHEHHLDAATVAMLRSLGLSPDRVEALVADIIARGAAQDAYRLRQVASTMSPRR